MPKKSHFTGQQLIKRLEREGFQVVRKRGSHRFIKHPDGRAVIIGCMCWALLEVIVL